MDGRTDIWELQCMLKAVWNVAVYIVVGKATREISVRRFKGKARLELSHARRIYSGLLRCGG